MFKQTLYLDIWSALYHLAIAARNHSLAALVYEANSYRVTYKPQLTPADISAIGNLNPAVIIVNGQITKNDLATHHAQYLNAEISANFKK